MTWEEDFGDFLDQSVHVEPYLGTGTYGEVWGPETKVDGVQVEESSGRTRSADSTDRPVIAQLAVSTIYAPLFPAGSKVRLPSGKSGTVSESAVAQRSALGWTFQKVTVGP